MIKLARKQTVKRDLLSLILTGGLFKAIGDLERKEPLALRTSRKIGNVGTGVEASSPLEQEFFHL